MIGAGAIGLLSARLLAETGVQVQVLEQRQVGSEASWAGGGIISPLSPWEAPAAVTALSSWSQSAYRELAPRLAADSGIDPELHATGLYWLDLPDEELPLRWAAAQRVSMDRVGEDALRAAVPVLGPGYRRALHIAGVANIRNPRLLRALKADLQRLSNVEIQEECTVTSLVQSGGRLVGVRTADGIQTADQVVLCAGAWSGELLRSCGLELPVEPVKGQMILYKCAPDFLSAMVMANGRYAIPRRDGHVLVGSTLERVGFDKIPTEKALRSLRESAEHLLPALAEQPVVRHWAGLRPGSPDGIPFIGPVPGIEGLWLNCGHYRNGLVMAPASCHLLVDLMLGREPIVDPAPYAPAARLRPLA